MSVPEYEYHGPLTATSNLDLSGLVGKSIIITGGADGLGKEYAKAFYAAGAYVTIGDVNESLGSKLAAELAAHGAGGVQFVKCDVRNWEEQVALFEEATKKSPHKSCDVVIANAGVSGPDALFALDDPALPPVKPELRTYDINLGGLLYTTKLALHYFRRQEVDPARDRCLIIKSSIAGYLDLPRSVLYNVSKFGARAVMRCLRRTSWEQSIRVNVVAPWYIRTAITNERVQQHIHAKGAEFALAEDSAKAMLRIASDRSVNGRSLGIVPRSWAAEGYLDLDQDDFKEGHPAREWQEQVLHVTRPIEAPAAAEASSDSKT